MAGDPKRVRIFVSSPGDVADEREQLSRVVNSLNATIAAVAPEKGITLELVRYETHTHPDINAAGAQGSVNEQLGGVGEYDVFVGIMWKRFGTPTPHAQSGTEEEFNQASEAALKQLGRIRHVIFYFCQEKITIPRTREEWEQMGRVISFRERLSAMGLVGEYSERAKFGDIVKSHLDLVLSRIFSERGEVAQAAERVGVVALSNTSIREQVLALARTYVEIRRQPFTNERTQKLENVFTQMKELAFLAYSLLPELTESEPRNGGRDERAGERLAAVALLDAIPDARYFGWLADRCGREPPFTQYHAAVALLNAARSANAKTKAQLREPIERALAQLDPGPSDRRSVLEQARSLMQP